MLILIIAVSSTLKLSAALMYLIKMPLSGPYKRLFPYDDFPGPSIITVNLYSACIDAGRDPVSIPDCFVPARCNDAVSDHGDLSAPLINNTHVHAPGALQGVADNGAAG